MKPNSKVSFKQILWLMDEKCKIDWPTLSKKESKVLNANMFCHSEVYGFIGTVCPNCGTQRIHYGSCNTSGCLECGVVRKEKWLDKQRRKIVKAPYHHIVFTIPHQLNELFLAHRKTTGNLFFQAVAEALKTISADPKYFGATKIGFFEVEHTWGAALNWHPHRHVVLCGAGLDDAGNLVYPKYETQKPASGKKKGFIFPAKKLAALFKKILLNKLCEKFEYTGSPWLNDLNTVKEISWQIQICEALSKPDSIIDYLGRYVNRTAISNSRIQSYDGEHVMFTYKSYRNNGKIMKMTLKDTEFLRRFTMHIPPEHYTRIRYYGFLGPNGKKDLEKIQQLTGTPPAPEVRTTEEILMTLMGENYNKCPKCAETMEVEIEEPRIRKISEHFSRLRKIARRADIQGLVVPKLMDYNQSAKD